MKNTLSLLVLFAVLVYLGGVARAETGIVPLDRKPGEGYRVNPRDQAANLAICGSRCDDRDSSRQGYVTNGGWGFFCLQVTMGMTMAK